MWPRCLFCLGILFSTGATANELEIPRLSSSPVIDGELDDDAWESALLQPLDFEVRPGDNATAPLPTIARVGFDDRWLYVAFRAEDPDAGNLRSRYTRRDAISDQDAVGFYLDLYGDGRRVFAFFVNPHGVQYDATYNDLSGQYDSDFDAIWKSEAKVDDRGYQVELAIPLRSLRGSSSINQVWAMRFIRYHQRQDVYEFHSDPLQRGRDCLACQFRNYGVAGIDMPAGDVEIVPTATSFRSRHRPDAQSIFDDDAATEVGVDIQWDLGSATRLNATINPDFSQVEADPAQLTLNRQFPLFVAEQRPFFLDGRDVFETPLSLVYTRNIVDPEWGAKFSSRGENAGFAAFYSRDEETHILLPQQDTAVFSIRDMVSNVAAARGFMSLSPSLQTGVTATHRGGDDYRNSVVAVDGDWRLSATDTLGAQLAASATVDPAEGVDADARAFLVDYVHGGRNLLLDATLSNFERDFRADAGFVPRAGASLVDARAAWRWWGDGDDWFRQLWPSFSVHRVEDEDGRTLDMVRTFAFDYRGPYQSSGTVAFEDGTQWFDGDHYTVDRWKAAFSLRPSHGLLLRSDIVAGDAIDLLHGRPATVNEAGVAARIMAGERFDMELRQRWQRLEVMDRKLYRTGLSEIRAVWYFDANLYLRWIGRWQETQRDQSLYSTSVPNRERDWANQVLLAYLVNPRTGLYAGYSDGRSAADAEDLARLDYTVFLKLSYAWQL